MNYIYVLPLNKGMEEKTYLLLPPKNIPKKNSLKTISKKKFLIIGLVLFVSVFIGFYLSDTFKNKTNDTKDVSIVTSNKDQSLYDGLISTSTITLSALTAGCGIIISSISRIDPLKAEWKNALLGLQAAQKKFDALLLGFNNVNSDLTRMTTALDGLSKFSKPIADAENY